MAPSGCHLTPGVILTRHSTAENKTQTHQHAHRLHTSNDLIQMNGCVVLSAFVTGRSWRPPRLCALKLRHQQQQQSLSLSWRHGTYSGSLLCVQRHTHRVQHQKQCWYQGGRSRHRLSIYFHNFQNLCHLSVPPPRNSSTRSLACAPTVIIVYS